MKAFKAVKKPVEIEAIQLTESSIFAVRTFIDGKQPVVDNYQDMEAWMVYEDIVKSRGMKLMTLESDGQTQVADIGDYIIKGIQGEFYPCKPDIFEATYDFV